MRNYISEDQIERSCIEVCLDNLKYDKHFNCYKQDHIHRNNEKEVLDKTTLLRHIKRINASLTNIATGISNKEAEEAFNQIAEIDFQMDKLAINRAILTKICKGVTIKIKQKNGKSTNEIIHFIDWAHPEQNEFFIVNQLWIQGDIYRLRPDLIVYINGIPLVTIELKNSNVDILQAYEDNLTRYKEAIPALMAYNAFLIASNGVQTRVGATYASWEYFFPWLRVKSENEKIDKEHIKLFGRSLDYALLGLLNKKNLLDYIQNFILFYKGNKICAKNHQFMGVNKAIDRFDYLQNGNPANDDKGKMGVFWHTQGSGKSFSMVFMARKIVRQFHGDYTFLVITDREDLHDQIYKNFLHSGFMGESDDCLPKNSERLRELLKQNKKILFTLIQKFRYDKSKKYPLLSDRSDIIVIIDEAHRTQYKDLAENLRIGLPNAQYIAFTGTPLFGSKKLTNQWFGANVSEYTFMQAIEDGATVRLVYQNHLPELQNQNPTFNDDFAEIISDEELTDEQQRLLEKEHATELQILKSPARLDKIARDIVRHFPNRGYLGKAMVISVDKVTAVRMYDLVKHYWRIAIQDINKELNGMDSNSYEYTTKLELRNWMKATDMAVVVCEEAGEEEKFQKEGLDIKPHRKRMKDVNDEGQDIEDLFKSPGNPLRIVFVCSMWLTGFDAPTVSTLYLDKPVVGHTLMQTIARANRTTDILDIFGRKKEFGHIIAYCNVFGKLRKALAQYGESNTEDLNFQMGTSTNNNEAFVETPEHLYTLLHQTIDECVAWCKQYDVDLQKIIDSQKTFSKIADFDYFANQLFASNEIRAQFCVYDNVINTLYNECLPDIIQYKDEFKMSQVIHYLRQVMNNNVDRRNIESARRRIKDLLHESILPRETASNYNVAEQQNNIYSIRLYKEYDLSKLNIKQLREEFKTVTCKNLEINDLREFLRAKLERMLSQNAERAPFAEQLQNIIDRYNAGSLDSEHYLDELLAFASALSEEQQRAAREELTEEELEIFDILKKEKMTKKETLDVKLGAKNLLAKLKENKVTYFPTEWFKDSSCKSVIKNFITDELNLFLPNSYSKALLNEKEDKLLKQFIIKASQDRLFA